jgi:hypothetical protein
MVIQTPIAIAALACSVAITAAGTYFVTRASLPAGNFVMTASCPTAAPAPVHDPAMERFNAPPRVPVTGHRTW